MKTKTTKHLKQWFFLPLFLLSLMVSAQGSTIEGICATIGNEPILTESIASYPLTDLSNAAGDNNTEIIPGVNISDTDGLCLDYGIVDNFTNGNTYQENLDAIITNPDVLNVYNSFDFTPVEDNFDPLNFGISFDFNIGYEPPNGITSDGVVGLGAIQDPYMEFLGMVYNYVTEQVGILLANGDILYAEVNVPLNEWHTVEVKHVIGLGGFVYLNGELVLAVNTIVIDTEQIELDVEAWDLSGLTTEGALAFLAQFAGLGEGYGFCLRNVEFYRCVLPLASEVPPVTEECSVELEAPTAWDICSGTVVGTTDDPTEYAVAGTYIVNWEFTSANGAGVLTLPQTVIVTATDDADGDGVCDDLDVCPSSDDTIDANENGIPDCAEVPVVDNCPDDSVNLALLDDATLSGSVAPGDGRGTPLAILYDPLLEDYRIRTRWNEYGVDFQEDLGTPDADNGFFWRVDWETPKAINYITIGGMYPNQPQPDALWRVSYLFDGVWTTLEEGVGDWIVNGIYKYDGRDMAPITADAMRIQVYSDGVNEISSIHLRGRGGISTKINDSATTPKATLFMYLPQEGAPDADFTFVKDMLNVDFDASASTDDDGSIVNYQFNFGDGTIVNSASPMVSHTFAASGTYTVKLTATDNEGKIGVISKDVTVSDGAVTNTPNENINLALLDDATLSGSVPDGDGRGKPGHILYDPLIDDYRTRTAWNEYGVDFRENLGRPDADNGFFWQVDWDAPKAINYVSIGGTYPNQPQPNALWRVSYLVGSDWVTLDEGQGGWIDSGIFEWVGTDMPPIIADAMRVQVYSDGNTDLQSIHLRGRGGVSNNINDSGTTPKATLIMYLPSTVDPGLPTADFVFTTNGLDVDFDASASTDDQGIVDYTIDFGDGVVETYSGTPTTFSHTYASPGTYDVTLTVVDGDNNEDSITKQVTVSDGSTTNEPDENTNLALLDDATLSGSVADGDGRGTPMAILYDPLIDNYRLVTDWNEYGVDYQENLGMPDADNGFKWQVDWAAPKLFNYVTFGGTYPSQPQYGSAWRISYLNNGEWITLDEGVAGWINSGIFEWDGRDEPALEADAMRVQVFSDGDSDVVSIHLRGRGGISNNIDDSATATKASLIQYLPELMERSREDLNTMRISPNPTDGRALVSFSEVTDIEVIEIYDLSGRRVQEIKGGTIDREGKRISVHGLPQGIYTVIATSKSGVKYQEKLIVKK